MIRITQLKLSLHEEKDLLLKKAAQYLHISPKEIKQFHIFKESIDARKQPVVFRYSVDLEVEKEERFLHLDGVMQTPDMTYKMPQTGEKKREGRIVVAGFGPAGMFAALLLAQKGYRPLVLERGACVEERIEKVETFWRDGILDERSNVQFGEGGAGTFSDGKLTTRSKDLRCRKILQELVRFGAPEDVLYQAHPHIGTDLLRDIVKRIRMEILALGGEIRFLSQLDEIYHENGEITSIRVQEEIIPCAALILAIGHSARDTFAMLQDKQVDMEAKAFAVGVRIEHFQSMIDQIQYKQYAHHPKLKAAEYRLTHTTKKGRGVYTFCMCPGGSVVASASQANGVVVNGMSERARDKENANSALLVQVYPSDFGEGVLDGIAFQKELEEKAFQIAGKNYAAPAQYVLDYLNQKHDGISKLQPTYQPQVTYCDLHQVLPDFVNEALEEALPAFDRKMPGFAGKDAIMTGVETRSSSPVRILRCQDTLQSSNISYLYPCGEGAGYAGGIVSAAIDGLRCAEKVIETFHK